MEHPIRTCVSPDYNYLFNTETGFFARWGKTTEDDPQFSPIGPEIADIEIAAGRCSGNCPWCYKSNSATAEVRYMNFETFQKVFAKLPPNIMQIAFGITDINANPDLWKIMQFCREKGVVPNITVNGNLSYLEPMALASICGAVAVSNYNKDRCYGCVELLSKSGLKQVNIHQLLSEETFTRCMQVMKDAQEDPRLVDRLNAIVFLLLKPKGMRNNLHQLKDPAKYKELIDYALEHKIRIGFDSCSANSFLRAIKGHPHEKVLTQCAEPCESTCFSIYIDVEGMAYPCSFSVGEANLKGINMLEVGDFMKEVWYSEEFRNFRGKLLNCGRSCPLWDVEIK